MAIRGVSRPEAECLASKIGFEQVNNIAATWPLADYVQLVVDYGCAEQQNLPSEKRYEVAIPGFEDIVHIYGNPDLTDGDLQLYKAVYDAYAPARAREILVDMMGESKVR